MALVMHELATNAAKYGCLSVPTGMLAVSWKLLGGSERRVRIAWRESGGPEVTPPTRTGFGSRLLPAAEGADRRGDHAILEGIPVIGMRERLRRDSNFEEVAERPPAFRDIPDEQPITRDRLLDGLLVPLHCGDQLSRLRVARGERAPLDPEHAVDQVEVALPSRVDLGARC